MVNIKNELRTMWKDSAALTGTAGLMLLALGSFGFGMLLDPRTVAGAPAWLKPVKFAISTALFCGTLAWLFRYLTVWPGALRLAARVISAIVIIEVAVIAAQAARGRTSHFNVATTLDASLFTIMGTSIFVLWLATVVILIALFRQQFQQPAWGWWLRAGLLVTVLGALAGGMMLGLTSEQSQAAELGQRPTVVGGHTVGAPDGGPGLPVTGWSSRHGDLRIAHFLGLHGIQVLPFLGWLATRRNGAWARRRFAWIAGSSYAALTAILAWQALRGQSLIAPDSTTMVAIGVWAAGTLVALGLARTGVAEASATERITEGVEA